jgi:broad specificity phosphatase PhoE
VIVAPKAQLKLYLVRHGETEWSLSGQHTGVTDIALTTRGEEQASALAPSLRSVRFTQVLTSPRQRARQTCALAGLEEPATVEPDLAEWDYGDDEGLRTAEIYERRPDWNVFRDGCPGGETPVAVAERADRLIAALSTLSGNVALFSHGQFGCAFGARWIGLPVIDGQHFALGPASLSILRYDPHHPQTRVIALWNAAPMLVSGHGLERV